MNLKNWMSGLSETTLLSHISIPGTHDSASFRSTAVGATFTQTQSWDIKAQLIHGIRFLDARCRLINDILTMHHGPVFLNQYFGDILATCISFLENNPTEFIILSVKQEHTEENSTKSFAGIMWDSYIAPNKSDFFLANEIPMIAEVRGKIVLLRRYGGSDAGINATPWKDDTTFSIKNSGFTIYVQDNYNGYTDLSIHFKRKFVEGLLKKAKNERLTNLYINFTSLSGIVSPYSGAKGHFWVDGMNSWFCKNYSGKQFLGIIVSDFVDLENGAIIKTIINSNNFI
ncbi:phosphatidylinositol-specific phospholipase C [Yersinia mollaretii]|uniref:phosphatidylinositol-specific phospholipase C n=1 Tax=Yersinia mollaretii TaxID=33060 RepID=UPI0005E55CE0|nr:phosphatidylinositol-specific phospholipase C [Yersinia mollaretii]MDA5525949.1 phosphatidylinositol-specific phospholipase C [Yersinia mollaretii]MDR7872054.1 phosphatidylinositol-specific phospholipase C [Yersinia mollaretii]PHZ31070.1 phosphatidylinositol diacylglycerol-lyase [Yersinia mollaretii]WQC73415.1 phosphatidylinositol-specific phospholipase C [Yersinia mollaretii]CNE18721.1 phosphatidylinositol diacylglycerol-lyase [Yersinia mollaretii]